jgi:hypothetical protein
VAPIKRLVEFNWVSEPVSEFLLKVLWQFHVLMLRKVGFGEVIVVINLCGLQSTEKAKTQRHPYRGPPNYWAVSVQGRSSFSFFNVISDPSVAECAPIRKTDSVRLMKIILGRLDCWEI